MDANSLVELVVKLVYVLAAALFIFGLKDMSHPKTAVRGNLLVRWAWRWPFWGRSSR